MSDIQIIRNYIPGSIGRVVELHGTYYHDHWNFGPFFESKVAAELAEFTRRYDKNRDGFWTASLEDRIEGSITIDGIDNTGKGAHLRWFIVSDALRGKGIGNRLIHSAMDFCRNKNYKRVYLWTFEGLNPARHLYEKHGFKLIEENHGMQWGREVIEQRFERRFQ